MRKTFVWWINKRIGAVIMELMDHQVNAVEQLGNGKILWGGVGSGKSATVLAYYMKSEAPRDIYVITTAKKRDSLDWEGEAAKFGIGQSRGATVAGVIKVDSWNNLGKYTEVKDAFFIFDEQRVVGYGTWVKNFLTIARQNHWVLLSATPGDTWTDYAPVFIANGYYKNITDFRQRHIVYVPRVKFPKVQSYMGVRKLELLRNEVLVEMPWLPPTKRVINWLDVTFDAEKFRQLWVKRWNVFDNKPIVDVAELFRLMRRLVNSDPSRLETVRELMRVHDKLVVFYNFDYELDILRTLADECTVAEWNGHKHEPIPHDEKWVYLVQYVSGAEGWNCTESNAMIFYSLTYSYKNFEQAMGRIDRMDTPFKTLYYYVLVTNSLIDRAIRKALSTKRTFNERQFMRKSQHEMA